MTTIGDQSEEHAVEPADETSRLATTVPVTDPANLKMAESGRNDDMFTNKGYLIGGDIEAGTNTGHVRYIEHNVEAPLEKIIIEGNNDNHDANIDKLVSSMERVLQDVPQYMCSPSHRGKISRIPGNLREIDINAYEPSFVSFGPYHHDKPRVQHMEKRKHLVLKLVIQERPDITLKDCLKEIKNIEPRARSFYSDVEMDSEKFTQMLLLDSLFLLTVFCGMATGIQTHRTESGVDNENMNDKVNELTGLHNDNAQIDELNEETGEDNNMPRWFWTLIVHDLFLLENQLPLFVLQKIYWLVYGGLGSEFIGLMTSKIGQILSSYTKVNMDMVISPTEEVHHLLHICHFFFRPTVQQDFTASQLPESSEMFRLGSAVQLYEAGVNFEARSTSTQQNLLDITFGSSGKMSMPCLAVDDNVISLLRNLIALEQMQYPSLGLHICAYAVLLLHLATNPNDVALLRKKGIIQHHLASDKEMMYVVNKLSVGLSFDYTGDRYSLKPIFQELNRYSKRRVPRWKAWLKIRHFNNPWTALSLLAASFLFLLSSLQTYYTMYSYYYPLP